MANTISNQDDVINSRDVIERIEELQSTLESYHDDQETTLSFEFALQDAANFPDNVEEFEELRQLLALQSEAESSPDWIHGECLIREDYFTDYIEELIRDCYPMPKEFDSGEWPWRHMTIDFSGAADEAKADYIEADFDGVTYLIRA